VSGNGAYEDEMNEVVLFQRALLAAVPVQPDPRIGAVLVPRLAGVARAATLEAETRATRRRDVGAASRSRLALVARVAIVVGVIPLMLAGLAFAGVNLPAPARDAFDSVGITLPNQSSGSDRAANQSRPTGTGNDVSESAKSANESASQGNSAAAHRHALQQRAKARGKALGHSRGKAIGLKDLTPPGQSGETGPPEHSNAGGSSSLESQANGNQHPFPTVSGRGQGGAHGHGK
jgi:hypothetical protein